MTETDHDLARKFQFPNVRSQLLTPNAQNRADAAQMRGWRAHVAAVTKFRLEAALRNEANNSAATKN